jgi:hypothetical protein
MRYTIWALLAAVATGIATAAAATDPVRVDDLVIPVADVDNGLGNLPHYTKWQEPWLHAVPAETIDSGLGDLPPVSEWREPWLYATPAEKLDSGLGELLPVSEWREPWLYATPAQEPDVDVGRSPTVPAATIGHGKMPTPGG